MTRLRKFLLIAVAALALATAAAWLFRQALGVLLLQSVAEHNVGRNAMLDLPDGLHLGLCGTGSPFPDPTRAGPCSAIVAGDRLFIVDAGEGSARNLGYMGLPAAKIEAIFLTHFHSDHIDGLGPFMLQRWGLGSFSTPTPVYGPTGVDKVVDGFRAAYVLDFGYRVAHHSERIMPPGGSGGQGFPFALPPADQGGTVVVLDNDGLKVTAFRVDHSPIEPAVGYRFDYKGRSIVISGDTKKVASVVNIAKAADILVHEALQPKLVGLLEDQFRKKKPAQHGANHARHLELPHHTRRSCPASCGGWCALLGAQPYRAAGAHPPGISGILG